MPPRAEGSRGRVGIDFQGGGCNAKFKRRAKTQHQEWGPPPIQGVKKMKKSGGTGQNRTGTVELGGPFKGSLRRKLPQSTHKRDTVWWKRACPPVKVKKGFVVGFRKKEKGTPHQKNLKNGVKGGWDVVAKRPEPQKNRTAGRKRIRKHDICSPGAPFPFKIVDPPSRGHP